MLVGLYNPAEGAIFYNEKNAKDIDLTELRQQLGFVTQDAQLFSGTIKDNLLFVKPDATDEEINDVLPSSIANEDDAVKKAAQRIRRKYKIANVLATRSECGLSLVGSRRTTHIPTLAQEVFDVSGAGDTVIAVFTLALAGGICPEAAAYLANLAASVVVAKLGTYAVSREELLTALDRG